MSAVPMRAQAGNDPPDTGPVHAEPTSPQPVDNAALAALQLLLRIENDAREAKNQRELSILIANETRKLSRARQIFVVDRARGGGFKIVAVSSVTSIERNAPLNQTVERFLARAEKAKKLDEMTVLQTDSFNDDGLLPFQNYPLRELLWVPMRSRSGSIFGGMLQAREIAWTERDQVVSTRLAQTYAHAWCAHSGRREPGRNFLFSRKMAIVASLAAVAAMFIPVPMSALAPAEIVARNPEVTSAPIDGVIQSVLVEPNTTVSEGQPLLAFADTELRNKFDIAEREVQVARARLKRATQLAFEDMRGRHELGIARAELALRITERDYARDLLAKTTIRATRDGIAIFPDKKALVGKPVAVGERLMELADPKKVALRIDMPVSDGQLLRPGAAAKVFLDSAPLQPINARVTQADYKSREIDEQTVAFRAHAHLEAGGRPLPRLGVKGTAQVYGEDVPLGLYLFRRPISAVRQWLGM